MYVGKWPIVRPGPSSGVAWANFFWGNKNMTLSVWDPAFFGGYHCGADKESLCVYYIGVHIWCEDSFTPPHFVKNFTVEATLHPVHAIFGVEQKNQMVSAGQTNVYKFCVSKSADVRATLKSFQDPCISKPDSYAWLNMALSQTDETPTIDGLTWRMIRNGEYRNYVDILDSLPNFNDGGYYLGVTGQCDASATTCAANDCSCGSCSTLTGGQYSLLVDWANTTSPTTSPSSSSSSSDNNNNKLDGGAIAGIVIALFIENVILVVITLLFCHCCREKVSSFIRIYPPNYNTCCKTFFSWKMLWPRLLSSVS